MAFYMLKMILRGLRKSSAFSFNQLVCILELLTCF